MAVDTGFAAASIARTWWQDVPRSEWAVTVEGQMERMRLSRFGRSLETSTAGDTWDVRRPKAPVAGRVDVIGL